MFDMNEPMSPFDIDLITQSDPSSIFDAFNLSNLNLLKYFGLGEI